jgi:hypothetical protein
MCACHGLEQGGTYRETLLQTLPQTPGQLNTVLILVSV